VVLAETGYGLQLTKPHAELHSALGYCLLQMTAALSGGQQQQHQHQQQQQQQQEGALFSPDRFVAGYCMPGSGAEAAFREVCACASVGRAHHNATATAAASAAGGI
jgi:hypothetical protein